MRTKVCSSPSFVPVAMILGSIVPDGTTAVLASWLGAGILVSAVVDAGESVWSRADYLAQAT